MPSDTRTIRRSGSEPPRIDLPPCTPDEVRRFLDKRGIPRGSHSCADYTRVKRLLFGLFEGAWVPSEELHRMFIDTITEYLEL
jgi:hypothetical protein